MCCCKQQKITDVKQLTNISEVRLLSVCCQFAVRCTGRRMFLCTISALEHLCTNRQLNICAHMVDEYFGRQFAVRLCTNGLRTFWTSVCCPFVHKRLTVISERKGKENSMKIKKITLKENANNCHRTKKSYICPIRWTANEPQTVVRCFSAQKVAWADLYPIAVGTSDVRLLSVCCLFAVQNLLLCRQGHCEFVCQ